MQPWEFGRTSINRKIRIIYLTYVQHPSMRCKHKGGHKQVQKNGCNCLKDRSQGRTVREKNGSGIVFPVRDARAHCWPSVSPVDPPSSLAGSEHCLLVCHSPHSATATQQSYIKYYLYDLIGLSMLGFQRALCVCVCAFCSSLPTWQNDWYRSNHSE